MNEKIKQKLLLSGLTILCLALIIVLYIFWPRGESNTDIFLSATTTQSCNPYLDISTIVKTGDLKSCDCLATSSLKTQCQANISNATSYTNALTQSNVSACNNISDLGMKSACIKIIQGKINFANKQK